MLIAALLMWPRCKLKPVANLCPPDRKQLTAAQLLALACLSTGLIPGATEADSITFTGTTGPLVTPNALIATPDTLLYQYNNHMESRFDTRFKQGSNHVFTLGVFDRLELSGRLTDFIPVGERHRSNGTLAGKRDLSGNAKLNIINYRDRYWLSLGATDFAGLAQNFSSLYAVGTAAWRKGQFSVGYVSADDEPSSGLFANLHYALHPRFSVAAEVDAEQKLNGGVIANLPVNPRVSLLSTLSGGDSGTHWGVALKLHLRATENNYTALLDQHTVLANDAEHSVQADHQLQASAARSGACERTDNATDTSRLSTLKALSTALNAHGFQRVRVGAADKTYRIELEKGLYIHTEYDTVTQVLRLARSCLPATDHTVELTLLDNAQPAFRSRFNLQQATSQILPAKYRPGELVDTQWLQPGAQSGHDWVRLKLAPALISSIGTELGTVDYSIALGVEASLPLWKGAAATIRGRLPVANSTHFKPGKAYGHLAFDRPLESALIRQYIPHAYGLHSQLQAGRLQVRGFDYNALKAEALWQTPHAPLRLQANVGQYRLLDHAVRRNVFIGSASYTLRQWDSVVSASYGQFFFGERGVKLTATRRMGNVHATAFIKLISKDDMIGGLQLSLPVGPSKTLRWNRLSLSGSSRWSHGLHTTIKYPDSEKNSLQFSYLYEPLQDNELSQRVLDSGRLSAIDLYQRYPNTARP